MVEDLGPLKRSAQSISRLKDAFHTLPRELRELKLDKLKIDISRVPDWQRRAARLSIAVFFFGALGHCLEFPPEYTTLAANFRQSCNWAAITCIVVTAPLIGKVAQVAFDRLLGTLVGAFIGVLAFTFAFEVWGSSSAGGVFISAVGAATVWGTTYLAYKKSLDQLARFMMLTYCIVAFGAKPDKGATLVALLRVGGIFAGGLLSVVLAVVVLPRSASVESLREMKKALKAMYDLNKEVWALSGVMGGGKADGKPLRKHHRHGYSAILEHEHENGSAPSSPTANGNGNGTGNGHRKGQPDGGYRSLARGWPGHASTEHLDMLVHHDEELDKREAVVEKLFTDVYASLGRVEEALGQTKGEIYVWHFWGRYFFLPGVHWLPVPGRWSVPCSDLQNMATCLRRLARMLWTLLLDFKEGFGADMEETLAQYYPRHLLSELAIYQARSIMDLLSSFPNKTTIEVDNLFTLGQVTDCLLQISDARARQTVFTIKRRGAAAAAASSAGASLAGGGASGGGGGGGGRPSVAGSGSIRASHDAGGDRRVSREQTSLQRTRSGRVRALPPLPPLGVVSPFANGGHASGAKGGGGGEGSGVLAGTLRRSVDAAQLQLQQQQQLEHGGKDVGQLEKKPLLSDMDTSTAAAANASARTSATGMLPPPPAVAVHADSSTVPRRLSTAGGSGGAAAPAVASTDALTRGGGSSRPRASLSGASTAVFTSRLLAALPGEQVSLELPPRRLLQQLQKQQSEKEQEEAAAVAAGASASAPAEQAQDRSQKRGTGSDWLQPWESTKGAAVEGEGRGGGDGSSKGSAQLSGGRELPPAAQSGGGGGGGGGPAKGAPGSFSFPMGLEQQQQMQQQLRASLASAGASVELQAVSGNEVATSGGTTALPSPSPSPATLGPAKDPPAALSSHSFRRPRLPTILSDQDIAASEAQDQEQEQQEQQHSSGGAQAGPGRGVQGSAFAAAMSLFASATAQAALAADPALMGPVSPPGGGAGAHGVLPPTYTSSTTSGDAVTVLATARQLPALGGTAEPGGGAGAAAHISPGNDNSSGSVGSLRASLDLPTGLTLGSGMGAVFAAAASGKGTDSNSFSRSIASPFVGQAEGEDDGERSQQGGISAGGAKAPPGGGGAKSPAAAGEAGAAGGVGSVGTGVRSAPMSRQGTSPQPLGGLAVLGSSAGAGGGAGVEGAAQHPQIALYRAATSTLLQAAEPVTFPATEEGYIAQVRWFSFQFIVDEIVNELEEAFYACANVLRQLPYPIGN